MNILHQFQLLLDPFDLVVQFGPYLFVIGDGRQGSLHPEVELDLGLRTRRTDTDTGAVLGIPLKYVALILLQMRLLSGDRKSTRLNSSHANESRMPSSA